MPVSSFCHGNKDRSGRSRRGEGEKEDRPQCVKHFCHPHFVYSANPNFAALPPPKFLFFFYPVKKGRNWAAAAFFPSSAVATSDTLEKCQSVREGKKGKGDSAHLSRGEIKVCDSFTFSSLLLRWETIESHRAFLFILSRSFVVCKNV